MPYVRVSIMASPYFEGLVTIGYNNPWLYSQWQFIGIILPPWSTTFTYYWRSCGIFKHWTLIMNHLILRIKTSRFKRYLCNIIIYMHITYKSCKGPAGLMHFKKRERASNKTDDGPSFANGKFSAKKVTWNKTKIRRIAFLREHKFLQVSALKASHFKISEEFVDGGPLCRAGHKNRPIHPRLQIK